MLNLTRVFLESTNAEALLRAPSPQDDGQKGSLRRLNKPNARVFKTESALKNAGARRFTAIADSGTQASDVAERQHAAVVLARLPAASDGEPGVSAA